MEELVTRADGDRGAHLADMISGVEERLRADRSAVSMNSGTTCCMVELSPTGLVCANVGDSRAILIPRKAPDLQAEVSSA